ncbi:Glycine cleavage system H protein [anaerobic digester metagenome]
MANFEVRALPLYTKEDTWVRIMPDGTTRVGITDYAQKMLKEINYIDMPSEGDEVTAGKSFASAESVKALSDVISPISGTIIAVNESVMEDPSIVNGDPYDGGWMIAVNPTNLDLDKAKLLDAAGYKALLAEKAAK